ncbi:hypothetical protein COLO4_35558 [Corchorus olitorius]|uniref:Protein kinase domain-containing protein n=1 Tax=Corchorus olitorius TaxID=93759 RepID=A0A1R3GFD8_9ROSI|nr:hypothetical protein COLO4_35558 [Corchorus olitorius]
MTNLQSCCAEKPALALYPSCTIQYGITPFYERNRTTADAPPPALPPPPLLLPSTPPGKSGRVIKIVVPAISFLVFSFFFCCVLVWKARKKRIAGMKRNDGISKATAMESLQFDSSVIDTATNNFAEVNKIGAGGFGSVYKGLLPNGQEIAVKRLSRSSGQGAEEFQNGVSVVAKLQHRNLVKLSGYCLEREERMLIYEFVPNKSLDYFIFGLALSNIYSTK